MTKPRNTNAIAKAIKMEITVSLMELEPCACSPVAGWAADSVVMAERYSLVRHVALGEGPTLDTRVCIGFHGSIHVIRGIETAGMG